MLIALAQTRSFAGDITANITHHQELVELAVAHGANAIIFPELSLTGYEPTLAKDLATTAGDNRLAVFQEISDKKEITIGIGVPLGGHEGITISLLFFQPMGKRNTYSKQFLHPDEEPFFVPGQNQIGLLNGHMAPAICYELSVPEHAERAFQSGAQVYLASVAKSAEGVRKAKERLSAIAAQFSINTLMVNGIGWHDGMLCTGGSAAWDRKGKLLAQLNDHREGLLLFDTEREAATEQYR